MPLLGRGNSRKRSLSRQQALLPVEGVDFSAPADVLGIRRGFGQNMYMHQGLMKKIDGMRPYGTTKANGGAIMNMVVFELTHGAKRLIRATPSILERFNTTTSEWDYVEGPIMGATDDDFIDFAVCSELDNLIITQKNRGNIKRYADGGHLVDLGGSPGKAGTCDWLTPYLIIGDLEESGTARPQKVKWCDSNALTTWGSGNAGSKLLAHEASPIKKLLRLNEQEMAYKQQSIYSGRVVSTSEVISWAVLKTNVGLYSARGVAGHQGLHFFMGDDDFYVNNSIQVESIGRAVRDYIFPRLNTDRPDMSWAMVVDKFREVWFNVCVGGNDFATERWRYNYDTGFWYFDAIDRLTAGIVYQSVGTRSWDDLIGTWDEQTFNWDDREGGAAAPITIIGDYDGKTYRMTSQTKDNNGVAIDAYHDSVDFTADERASKKDWLECDLWARGTGSVKAYYSKDEGRNWTFINSYELPENFGEDPIKIYFHVKASRLRLRFRNADSEKDLWIKSFQPYFMVTEEAR